MEKQVKSKYDYLKKWREKWKIDNDTLTDNRN